MRSDRNPLMCSCEGKKREKKSREATVHMGPDRSLLTWVPRGRCLHESREATADVGPERPLLTWVPPRSRCLCGSREATADVDPWRPPFTWVPKDLCSRHWVLTLQRYAPCSGVYIYLGCSMQSAGAGIAQWLEHRTRD